MTILLNLCVIVLAAAIYHRLSQLVAELRRRPNGSITNELESPEHPWNDPLMMAQMPTITDAAARKKLYQDCEKLFEASQKEQDQKNATHLDLSSRLSMLEQSRTLDLKEQIQLRRDWQELKNQVAKLSGIEKRIRDNMRKYIQRAVQAHVNKPKKEKP